MYEHNAWMRSEYVLGVDEVGRSCLAGPVVAAAAILRPGTKHRLLKDSKMLSPEEREIAYHYIVKNSWYSVGIMHHRMIDDVNIYHANIAAMRRAVVGLLGVAPWQPSVILVDFVALKLDHVDIPVIHFAKGESKSCSIAAASIIAKVTRDALMGRVNMLIPGFGFDTNKGYGSVAHRKEINQAGHSFMHRMSFLRQKSPLLFSGPVKDSNL